MSAASLSWPVSWAAMVIRSRRGVLGVRTRATGLLDRNVGRHSRLALHVGDHVRVVLAERCDAVAELPGDLRQALGAVADQQARERVT